MPSVFRLLRRTSVLSSRLQSLQNFSTTSRRSRPIDRDFRKEEQEGGLGRSKITVIRVGLLLSIYLVLQRVVGELLRTDEYEWDYEDKHFITNIEKEQKSKQQM